MTLPAYPSTIAFSPEESSWSMTTGLAPLQTPMTGGNTRRRSLPGSDIKLIQQNIPMTYDDWDILSAFIADDLNHGASRFTMSVWLGTGYATKTVQFVDDSPTITRYSPTMVQVAMKLMVFKA